MLSFIKPTKEYASKARSFSDLLTYAVRVDEYTILNTDGSYMATYRYRGADMGAAGGSVRHQLSQRINNAMTRFEAGWMFHFSTERLPTTGYPTGSNFSDPTSWIVDEVRRIKNEQLGANYINEYWLDVTYLPPTDNANRGEEFLIEGSATVGAEHAREENIKHFRETLVAFESVLGPDLSLERVGITTIDGAEGPTVIDEQLSHLIKCATNRDIQLRSVPFDTHIAPLVACASLRNGFRLRIGDQLVTAFTVNDMPEASKNGMFEILDQLSGKYRATWRFIVRDRDAALKDIVKERNKWFGKRRSAAEALSGKESNFPNQDAMKMAADASAAEADSHSGDAVFGYFTMTVLLWERVGHLEKEDDAWARLMKNQDYVTSSIHRLMHFQTFFEQENVLEAFLGSLPGIGHAQLRKPMLSSKNFADFIPSSAVWTGSQFNPCKFYPDESPALAYVSTNGSTPFYLNTHVEDVGHFLVTGETGAGKSVLLGFLLAQHRRYENSRQIVFDKDRSHYALTNAVGGAHYEVTVGDTPQFCPLAYIREPVERAWAETWLLDLLERSGQVKAPNEKREQIFKALHTFSKQEGPYSLSLFLTMPQLDHETREAIRYYTIEGSTGGLLDAEENTLGEADFICFEMAGLFDAGPALQEPTLTYLFHYVERLCDGRPTMLVLEEVWQFLDNPRAGEALKRWLKLLRKANVAVGFANQSLREFIDHPLADTLLSNCFTKILLANPSAATPQAIPAYAKIGLTPWQIKQISRATRKRDYFILSPLGRRLVSLNLSAVELAFIGISEKAEVARLAKLVNDERAFLAEHPNATLRDHIPWQATWLTEHVEASKPGSGEGWGRLWLKMWAEMGGYRQRAEHDLTNAPNVLEIARI